LIRPHVRRTPVVAEQPGSEGPARVQLAVKLE